MTLQTVIHEVCAFVGVRPPNGSVFVSPYVNRTSWEFVQLANEMAQRIAYDTRDWQALRKLCTIKGAQGYVDPDTGLFEEPQAHFPLPPDFQRMLVSSQVWRSSNTLTPMEFIADPDDWIRRERQNETLAPGEWTIYGNHIHIRPELAPFIPEVPGDELADPPTQPIPEVIGETATFWYMRNTPIRLLSGGFGTQFLNSTDTFLLSERLLKLGLIWQWKANKGATYAEDLANYEDALAKVAGADKPSPIIIG